MSQAKELDKPSLKEGFNGVLTKGIDAADNCITGADNHLLNHLREAFKKAKKIDIIVSFLMESGVRLLEDDLIDIKERKIPIRILTGNYLNITQPQALYMLKDIFGDKVDLRFYREPKRSFHPKAYIIEYEEGGVIFVGSSNISKSALTSGIEWNYKLNKESNSTDFNSYKVTFKDLFLNHSIIVDEEVMKSYSKGWKRPKLYVDIEKSEADETKVIEFPRPTGAQIEALYELKKARAEGLDKALVVAATGIGKTYLSAFDSKEFKKVLFVAHRDEILTQAERSFKIVRPEADTGIFNGSAKEKDKDIIFASVQTLGQKQYLQEEYFNKDEFDYIIIDEFHHAVAGNYQNIMEYFTPKFLLGLTATPERLDNKDVFALCDYNVVYETRLKAAIDKGWLVPFRYYGIYDDSMDYEKVDFKNGKYDEKLLEEALMINKRANLILENYKAYRSDRALGFCTSRKHAEYMAKYFSKHGIKATSVVSSPEDSVSMDRADAIKKFQSGEVNVIFSVDMFNEGLDVPTVDMVMFLRPTESPTVFLQQLGRGLRRSKDKNYLNVLDFIGNYKKANLVPYFLTGNHKNSKGNKRGDVLPQDSEYPEDCFVHIDFRLIDIFKKMREQTKKIEDKVIEEFYRIKDDLKHCPSRLELFTYMDDDLYANIRSKANMNIFNDYLSFLKKIDELDEDEQTLIGTKAHEFIQKIETTQMTQTYKMPLLLAFYNDGDMRLNLSDKDIYESFRDFYNKGSNGIDLLRNKSTKAYKNFGAKEYLNIAKNPKDAFINSAKEFFYIEGNYYCLTKELDVFANNKAFLKHFKDVIDYRTRKFYKERLEKEHENL